MNTPKLSIIIPTYNQEQYVNQAINSALNQKTNFDFEIIIGDDCSLDNTASICEEVADKFPDKIIFIKRENNLGLIGNYLDLIGKAKGKYIAILEGDDYWICDEKIQMQYDFLEHHKDFGLVHTNCYHYFDESDSKVVNLNKEEDPNYSGALHLKLLYTNFITAITICFRAQLLKQKLKEEVNVIRQFKTIDYYILLTISKISKIGYLNELTSVYRVHQNSISNTQNFQKNLEFLNSTFDIKYFFLNKYNMNRDFKLKILNQYYTKVFLMSLKYEPYNKFEKLNFDQDYKNLIIRSYFNINWFRKISKFIYRIYNNILTSLSK